MGEISMTDDIGGRLRDLRTASGLSLDMLAERSGVSRAMLSKIERGEKNPTVRIVAQIAAGLDISVSRLLGLDERRRVIRVPAGSQRILADAASGYTRELLSPTFDATGLEFIRVVMPPGVGSGTFPAHRRGTEEYVAVAQGCVRLRLGDTDNYLLETGDAIFFEADVAHAFWNVMPDDESVFYLVINGGRRG